MTRSQAREIDRRAIEELGMSSLVLMENAARGAADLLERLGIAGPVVVCCGKGNNGGDGFALARHLAIRGHAVAALTWWTPEAMSEDAAANCRILERAGMPPIVPDGARLPDALSGADWIVDALLGTGIQGTPRPPFDAIIAALNEAYAKKLALDVPSGLDCDTGLPAENTFRADHTCTFAAEKVGFAAPAAAGFLGAVHVADIGAPLTLLDRIELE